MQQPGERIFAVCHTANGSHNEDTLEDKWTHSEWKIFKYVNTINRWHITLPIV